MNRENNIFGYSLIELLVGIVIGSLLTYGAYRSVSHSLTYYRVLQAKNLANVQALLLLKQMTDELGSLDTTKGYHGVLNPCRGPQGADEVNSWNADFPKERCYAIKMFKKNALGELGSVEYISECVKIGTNNIAASAISGVGRVQGAILKLAPLCGLGFRPQVRVIRKTGDSVQETLYPKGNFSRDMVFGMSLSFNIIDYDRVKGYSPHVVLIVKGYYKNLNGKILPGKSRGFRKRIPNYPLGLQVESDGDKLRTTKNIIYLR
jgi:type II secretory pathway pseudopilin PulG